MQTVGFLDKNVTSLNGQEKLPILLLTLCYLITLKSKKGFFPDNFRHPPFIILECYNLYLSAPKMSGQNMTKVRNGSKMNIFLKKENLSFSSSNISQFG